MKKSRRTSWMILVAFLTAGIVGSPVPEWCVAADGQVRVSTGSTCTGESGKSVCCSVMSTDDECVGCMHFPAFTLGTGSGTMRGHNYPVVPFPCVLDGSSEQDSNFRCLFGNGFLQDPTHGTGPLAFLSTVVLIM